MPLVSDMIRENLLIDIDRAIRVLMQVEEQLEAMRGDRRLKVLDAVKREAFEAVLRIGEEE
jgi:BMFP domain-containing protein YqiC